MNILNYFTALADTSTASTGTTSDLFTFSAGDISMTALMLCTVCSLILGLVIALVFSRGEKSSRSFKLTLALLPAIVQMVIMLVNGDVGTGVAVMGAFGLVRFRSAPGSAKEITAIFLAMAAGLACGTQHLMVAAIFTLVICGVSLVYGALGMNGESGSEKTLKITVPESLDYDRAFDEVLGKYTASFKLDEVKTTNMGSLFKLTYTITMKDPANEKKMLDELRERNGNLEISCGRPVANLERL